MNIGKIPTLENQLKNYRKMINNEIYLREWWTNNDNGKYMSKLILPSKVNNSTLAKYFKEYIEMREWDRTIFSNNNYLQKFNNIYKTIIINPLNELGKEIAIFDNQMKTEYDGAKEVNFENYFINNRFNFENYFINNAYKEIYMHKLYTIKLWKEVLMKHYPEHNISIFSNLLSSINENKKLPEEIKSQLVYSLYNMKTSKNNKVIQLAGGFNAQNSFELWKEIKKNTLAPSSDDFLIISDANTRGNTANIDVIKKTEDFISKHPNGLIYFDNPLIYSHVIKEIILKNKDYKFIINNYQNSIRYSDFFAFPESTKNIIEVPFSKDDTVDEALRWWFSSDAKVEQLRKVIPYSKVTGDEIKDIYEEVKKTEEWWEKNKSNMKKFDEIYELIDTIPSILNPYTYTTRLALLLKISYFDEKVSSLYFTQYTKLDFYKGKYIFGNYFLNNKYNQIKNDAYDDWFLKATYTRKFMKEFSDYF